MKKVQVMYYVFMGIVVRHRVFVYIVAISNNWSVHS